MFSTKITHIIGRTFDSVGSWEIERGTVVAHNTCSRDRERECVTLVQTILHFVYILIYIDWHPHCVYVCSLALLVRSLPPITNSSHPTTIHFLNSLLLRKHFFLTHKMAKSDLELNMFFISLVLFIPNQYQLDLYLMWGIILQFFSKTLSGKRDVAVNSLLGFQL